MVSGMVSGAQCQSVRIQNLSSLASGVSFIAKETELYETGLFGFTSIGSLFIIKDSVHS